MSRPIRLASPIVNFMRQGRREGGREGGRAGVRPIDQYVLLTHSNMPAHMHTSLQVLEEKEREGSLLSQQQSKRPELLQRIQVRTSRITIPFSPPTLLSLYSNLID